MNVKVPRFKIGQPESLTTSEYLEHTASRIVRLRRMLLLFGPAFGIAAALMLVNAETPLYRSTGLVKLTTNPVSLQRVARLRKRAYNDEVVLFSTLPFREALLRELPEDQRSKLLVVKKRGDLATRKLASARTGLLRLNHGLEIHLVQGSSLIAIEDQNEDPQLAASIVTAAIRVAQSTDFEVAENRVQRVKPMLQQRLSTLQEQIQTLEEQLSPQMLNTSSDAPANAPAKISALTTKHREIGAHNSDEQTAESDLVSREDVTLLSVLDRGKTQADLELAFATARANLASTVKPEELPASHPGDPTLTRVMTELATSRSQYEALSATLGENNPELKQSLARTTELQRQLNHMEQNRVQMDRMAKNAAKTQSGLVGAAARSQQEQVERTLKSRRNNALIQINLAVDSILYRDLSRMIESLPFKGGLNESTIEVVDSPEVATTAESRHWRMRALKGMLEGLILSLFAVLFLWSKTSRIFTIKKLETKTGLPVLATLGIVNPSDWRKEVEEELAQIEVLMSSDADPSRHRVILLTSALPREGKTTVASNLAALLARRGRTVLLIDANFHRAEIHRVWHLPAAGGLSNLLEGKAELQELVKTVTLCDPLDAPATLDILTSGPRPLRTFDLLSSDLMKDLLQHARHTYQYVIIDSPSGSRVNEFANLASSMDTVLIVARYGSVMLKQIIKSEQALFRIGYTASGVIVNGIPGKR